MTLENFSRFDHLYDGPEEKEHHQHCPMSYKKYSTLCMCEKLNKAESSVTRYDYENWGE